MFTEQAQAIRRAVENLMNAKLQDLLTHSNALERLIAHRQSGVSSTDVREAERQLEQVLADTLPATSSRSSAVRAPKRAAVCGKQHERATVIARSDRLPQRLGDQS